MIDDLSPIEVLKAALVDAATIRNIALEAKIDAWSEDDYREEIQRDGSIVLKAVIAGEIRGFLLARTVRGRDDRPDLDLYNIAVRPAVKRSGIGSALMSELREFVGRTRVDNIWLEVRESNAGAIKFYEKHGFIAELTRPRFYRDPVENAVIMRLRSAPETGSEPVETVLDSAPEQE